MTSSHTIVLVGMMLSGKTTVGRVLAARLRCPFEDLDEVLVQSTGRTISEWFAQIGEPAFREAERVVVSEALKRSVPRVLATGGGAFEDPKSRNNCLQSGFVVYLEASGAALAARREGATGRPLLDRSADPAGVLTNLLEKRERNYLKAHCVVAVAGQTPDEIAAQILEAYERRYSS